MSNGELFVALLIALLMGILCWVACSYYTKLWHKRFRVRFQHHILCCIAAIFTVIFSMTFYAVGNLKFIVNEIIETWNANLLSNANFGAQTYKIAFYAVKELSPNDFEGIPEPGKKGSYIPYRNDQMIQVCVEIYVTEATDDFSTQHPFLDRMLSARPGISETEIRDDIKSFFINNPGEFYPLERAIEIAAKHIREGLLEQSPKTVRKTRGILLALFLAVQMIPFGTITHCANRDLERGK
jgi:hypothetical protein